MAIHTSDYALIIGVNDYPFHTKLQSARDDAEEFKKWLMDTDTGGGIPDANVAFLPSRVEGDEVYFPSPQDVDVKLRKLINLALENEEQSKPRRFYLYFSGHGLGVKATDVGLCLPFWSKVSNAGAMLKMSAYLNLLVDWGLFPEIFVFLDCCRNALQAPGGHEPSLTINMPNPGAAESKYLIAFATTYTNAAFEAEQKNETNPEENRGYFTRCLLEGLRGAAADINGGVPLNKLLEYLDGRVPQLAASKGKTQKAAYAPTFNLTEMSGIILGAAFPTDNVPGSKSIDRFPFSVSKPGLKSDYELSILTDKFERVYNGFDAFAMELPPGTYWLRSQKGDQIAEKSVHHFSPKTEIEAPELEMYSSILLHGAQSSHEYYTNEAIHWSRNMTDTNTSEQGSQFYFFARYPNKESAEDYNLFSDMSLLDENLKKVHRFPIGTYKENRQHGWYAFSYHCKPGQYYLRFDCHPTRFIPVYCFPEWQMQMFVTLKDRAPVFETLRILTAHASVGFIPNDWALLSDTAFNYLKNPELDLPPSLAQNLLYRKFENPIFGILGAYLVLQRNIENLLSDMPLIIENLKHLLNAPDCADMRAIQTIYYKGEGNQTDFTHPPMIALGIEMLLPLENKKRIRIPSDSTFAKMTLSRSNDLILSSWCIDSKTETQFDLAFGDTLVQFVQRNQEQNIDINKHLMARQLAVPLSKIEETLESLIQNSEFLDQINSTKKNPIDRIVLTSSLKQAQHTRKMKVVTICYPDDLPFLNELKENCLNRLQENGFLEHWDTGQILIGKRNDQIEQKIRDADCIIGLISMPYFGENKEVKFMHGLAINGGKIFIPIIVREGFYDIYPEISQNTAYPQENGNYKPLEKWKLRSEAWAQISRRLIKIKKEIN